METSRVSFGVVIPLALLVAACASSTHPTEPSPLGTPRSSADLLALLDRPGPAQVETVVAVDWAVPRSGLVNLEHPKAKSAGLTDGDEPIQVYLHAIRHPERGLYVIDTGVERAMRDDPDSAALHGIIARAARADSMQIRVALGDWLAQQREPLAGVLLTHLHLDHALGLPDVPAGTPIYAGPGETSPRALTNLFVQGVFDAALEGHGPIREWRFAPDAARRFAGVIDVFGDGAVWALWVPGHTPGSTAYLVRTPRGPVLFTGDASHTAWGWENQVEPGTYSLDQPRSAESLASLVRLVNEHPEIEVRLGHQPREQTAPRD